MIATIKPDWPAPPSVVALSTTRQGGVSRPPYDSLNVGDHVGDLQDHVEHNRRQLAQALPAGVRIQWLEQVHGTRVVEAGIETLPRADASYTQHTGVACAVLTADCLPVLFCSHRGDRIAAAHAGWRGLAAGVLENTVAQLDCAVAELWVWLGPAIGPAAFEVGDDVRELFLQGLSPDEEESFRACFVPRPDKSGHFLADLYTLARLRLARIGVHDVFGGSYCTFSDQSRFFSYRREGHTGRMVSIIALL